MIGTYEQGGSFERLISTNIFSPQKRLDNTFFNSNLFNCSLADANNIVSIFVTILQHKNCICTRLRTYENMSYVSQLNRHFAQSLKKHRSWPDYKVPLAGYRFLSENFVPADRSPPSPVIYVVSLGVIKTIIGCFINKQQTGISCRSCKDLLVAKVDNIG